MPDQVQLRGGTGAENDGFTGVVREVTVDTTNKTLRVHDGTTVGGSKLAAYDEWGRLKTVDGLADDDVANVGQLPSDGFIFGAQLTWDDIDDITFGTGKVADEQTSAIIKIESSLRKRSDAAWNEGDNQGGMDAGTKSSNGTLHCFIIASADGEDVDALFSESLSPTMPLGYTRFRRVGSVVLDGSAEIIEFHQTDDMFRFDVQVLDVDVSALTTTEQIVALSVPIGLSVVAEISWVWFPHAGGQFLVSSVAQTNSTPSTSGPLDAHSPGSSYVFNAIHRIETDQLGQIRHRSSGSFGSSDYLKISTRGWVDSRGRFS